MANTPPSILPTHNQPPTANNPPLSVSIVSPVSPRSPSAQFRSPPYGRSPGPGAHPSKPVTPRTGVSARSGRTTRSGLSGLSTQSAAIETLDQIINQLNKETENLFDEEEEGSDDGGDGKHPRSFKSKVNHFRAHLRHTLHAPAFHYTIIGMVIFDLIIVFIDLVVSLLNFPCYTDSQLEEFRAIGVDDPPKSPYCMLEESPAVVGADWFLWSVSVFLLVCFMGDITASLFAFGPKHFKKPLYAIDAVIVSSSLFLEVFFRFGNQGSLGAGPSALVGLRLWKIIRAIHAIAHSIELKNQAIIKEVLQAKAEVEEERLNIVTELERYTLALDFMKQKAPHVGEKELDSYVENELEKRDKEDAEAELKKDEDDEGDITNEKESV